MPRSGDIYAAPAGTTATTLTTIESSKYNAFVADLVTDLNTARPITAGGTGATTAAGAATNLFAEIAKIIFPVGSIKISTDSTNPGTYLTGTTWVAVAEGRAIVGVGDNGERVWTPGQQFGSDTHTLTAGEIPAHDHDYSGTVSSGGSHNHIQAGGAGINGGRYSFVNTGIANANTQYDPGLDARGSYTSTVADHDHTFSGTTTSVGSGSAHNNVQPSEAFYVWERTA